MCTRWAILLLFFPLLATAQVVPATAQALDKMIVTAPRQAAADVDGPDELRTYDESEIDSTGAFNLQEFIDALPRGANGETLVLIDGMPATMDLASLSPSMVAAIEVSYSGSMPAYGAYAKGRVINIRLKTDYDGRELSARGSGSLQGDGWRRDFGFNGAVLRANWRAFFSGQYSRNDGVTADARDFSREQDHRARGGRDFRTPWGDVAVVQAATGTLNGLVDPAGNPVRVALVPSSVTGPLGPGAFLPGTGPAAAGQRFFNTSPYLYLASPSESLGGNFRLVRTVGKLQFGVSLSYNTQHSERRSPPPVSSASTDTRVPAASNPFGQDVYVGLVHTGFGPVTQKSANHRGQLNLSAGWVGENWRLHGRINFSESRQTRDSRDLDAAGLTAALASADPATRFNPFVGAGSLANEAIYRTLVLHRTENTTNRGTQMDFRTAGNVGDWTGAGPVQLILSGNGSWRDNARDRRNQRGLADALTRDSSGSARLAPNLEIPLVKERAWLYRLEGSLGGTYAVNSGGGDNRRLRGGLSWSPTREWVFRASGGRNTATPGDRSDDEPESHIVTLTDPRRNPAAAENVVAFSNPVAVAQASHGDDLQLSTLFQPTSRPGWTFRMSYRQQRSSQATGDAFRPQDVIDNEALFAGRIVREAATVSDLLLNQPGRILAVDTSPTAVASELERRLDLGFELAFPSAANAGRHGPGGGGRGNRGEAAPATGVRGDGREARSSGGRVLGRNPVRSTDRVTWSVDVEYPFESRYEVAAGQGFVSREEGPANQPNWSLQSQVRWQHRQWNYHLDVRHSATSRLGTIPALTTASLNVNYRFAAPVWGKFGKGLQVGARWQNLGRTQPPDADTILGYRGGSALGPVFALSAQLPL